MNRGVFLAVLSGALGLLVGTAAAAGRPTPGGLYFQPPATEVKADIIAFHDLLMWIITGICALVLALLVWVVVRYNRAANPTPRRFSHNTLVEVIWTVVPVLILVVIAVFSFPLLAKEERTFGGAEVPPEEVVTIKAIGNSWFWQHDYQDYGVLVTSNLAAEEDLVAQGRGEDFRMATDEPILVPVNTYVRVLVTSNDVIHSWSVPSFGVKEDAIPGRVNEGWFNVREPGVYYGFCQELCGIRHAFMPIEVRAVSRAEFDRWIVEQGGTLPGSEPVTLPAPGATPPTGEPAAPAAAPAEPAPI